MDALLYQTHINLMHYREIKRQRRLIETVMGNWSNASRLKKFGHLTSRLNRKLLAHTVCRWLNRHASNPLQFEQLVTPCFIAHHVK
jgi:hypothetical protein